MYTCSCTLIEDKEDIWFYDIVGPIKSFVDFFSFFINYWDHRLEDEEIDMFIKYTSTSFLKEEEIHIAPSMDDEVFGEHIEE
jgi:hypothetical protein